MGILNVTPDSFSGDGLLAPDAHRRRSDRGGRGGRPPDGRRGRRPPRRRRRVDAARPRAGRRRTRSVAASCRSSRRCGPPCPTTPISIDTTKPAVAEAALAAGADLINDVWARRRRRRARPPRRRPRRPAGRHAQPRRAALHDVPGRARGRPPARDRPRAAARRPLGRPDRRSRLRLRQDARPQPRGPPRARRCCACSAARSCSGTSRKSTLGRVLDLPADQRARGDARDDRAGHRRRCRHRPGPRRAGQRPGRPDERRGRPRHVAAGPDRRRPARERPDRPRQHAVPGSPRRTTTTSCSTRSRSRSTSSCSATSSRPGWTTTSSRRSTTGRSTRPFARSSSRRRSGCSRRSPRRSATSSSPTSTWPRSCVRVRKPEVRLGGPLDYAGVEIRRSRPNGDRRG